LRSLADEGKKRLGSGVVAIVGVTEEGKAGVVVGVTDDLTSRFSAIDLVRKGAEALGGKGGGGRADMAQAGGPAGSQAEAAPKTTSSAAHVPHTTPAACPVRPLSPLGERVGGRGLPDRRRISH